MARRAILAGKILQLLATGFVLGFTKRGRFRREILEECDRIWYSIDRKQLNHALRKLKIMGLVKTSPASDFKERYVLTPAGKSKFLLHQYYTLTLKGRKRWDGKWRMVLFDIPEARRKVRDALRKKLKELGFLEFQKSVFIFPYPCDDEINFVINFLDIADYAYCVEAAITPDAAFRSHFKL